MSAKRYTLITGGAGFIGTNLADRLLSMGRRVLVFDNLSRAGAARNLSWLKAGFGDKLAATISDLRDRTAVKEAVRGAEAVFHLAAQAAVTKSISDPILDFEVNTVGTLNLLETLRGLGSSCPALIFTSTNKTYGALEDMRLSRNRTRYHPIEPGFAHHGISEETRLDFHSPYGCSKGASDQYVLDYARTFGLPALVFRMSCIYGPHQLGTEDQGWVAHFLISALEGKTITIYGDGRQVRDILYVEDLIEALLVAEKNIERLKGRPFNIGGGTGNTISLIELIDMITELRGLRPEFVKTGWRAADQKYYVSDLRKFRELTGWSPKISAADGIERLYKWLAADRALPLREAALREGVS